jgi:hypothetical protein
MRQILKPKLRREDNIKHHLRGMSREGIAFLQGIAGFCECGVEHH